MALGAGEPAERLPAAVLFLPACFVIEVILGGPAGIYGGTSVRFILLAASCCALIFAVLIRGRMVRQHLLPMLCVVGFVILNGIWIVIVPVLTGTSMHWALREPHAFIVFVPVVFFLAVLRRDQLAQASLGLQRIVVVTSLILAAFQVGLWVFGTLYTELRWAVPLGLRVIFGAAVDQVYVGPAPDGFFRVFWISTLWCVLSFFWIPVAFPTARFRRVFQGLLLYDILVAYTRGIWIGVIAGMIVAFAVTLTRHNIARSLARSLAVGALAAAVLGANLTMPGTHERGLSRAESTTSREDVSINARLEQAPYLLRLWYEHPIVGNGYGAYSPIHLRSDEAPYSYEHMPFALLAKLGVIGVLLNGIFLAGLGLAAWQTRQRSRAQAAAFLGSCVALLIAEMTNPMVLNFVSMSIFACLLVQWSSLVSAADRAEPWQAGSIPGRMESDGATRAERFPRELPL